MAPAHRNFTYSWLLRFGVAPCASDFMVEFGLDRAGALDALRCMEESHDAVLLPTRDGGCSGYMLMAHPFSNLRTPHTVELDACAVETAVAALRGADGLGCGGADGPAGRVSGTGGSVVRFGN